MMTDQQKRQIKTDNDRIIKQKGYLVNEWLPILETTSLRTTEEIKGRMSVMNAMINIAFEAPAELIKEWIENQNLTRFLSSSEKEILKKSNEELTDAELHSLRWYLEALWALMWVTGMTDDLEAENYVSDEMSSLLPDLEQGDNNDKINCLTNMRQPQEIYTMLDYYYRLHWYCVNERLNGRPSELNEGLVYERRKSLEWAYSRENDWDNVEMST
nr:DUF4272 domain-containing protein [uncultured Chryseobacterium sp.]